MHFYVTDKAQAKMLTGRLLEDMAQGRVSRGTVRKVYIQRTAFSMKKIVPFVHKCMQPCVKGFQLWLAQLKPSANSSIVPVAAFALAAVIVISFCSLNGEKRRLEAEKDRLVVENAQLNTDVESLTDEVDKNTSVIDKQDQVISDQRDQLDTIEDDLGSQVEDLLGKLEEWDLLEKVASRSVSHSTATSQLAQAKVLVEEMLGTTNEERAAEIIAKLDAEEAKIDWYADHYPDYYPTYGTLTSKYGWRRDPVTLAYSSMHEGIDIANGVGTPIYAAAAGTVISTGWDSGYGITVVIDHGNGYRTRYAHLSKALVSVGEQVGKASKIALMGASGRVTGSHLHFEVIVNGATKDPLLYVGR